LKVVIDVDQNSWVRSLVRSGDRHKTRRRNSTRACNLDLVAAHVELGTSGRLRGVQRDGFGADEVIAWCEVLGDGEGAFAAVGVERVLDDVRARAKNTFAELE
jgi:hypothetical protein